MFKLLILKLFNINNFHFSLLTLFPITAEFTLGKNTHVRVAKNVRAKGNFHLIASENAQINIGENTAFNYDCIISAREKIIIGEGCQIAPGVQFYDHDHDYKAPNKISDLKYKTDEIIIGKNVWIGANSIILKGTIIGDNCVIGAGTVVKGQFNSDTLIVQKKDITKIPY